MNLSSQLSVRKIWEYLNSFLVLVFKDVLFSNSLGDKVSLGTNNTSSNTRVVILIKLKLINKFPHLLSIYQIIDNPQNVFHVNNFTLKGEKIVLNISFKGIEIDTIQFLSISRLSIKETHIFVSAVSSAINLINPEFLIIWRMTSEILSGIIDKRKHFSEFPNIIQLASSVLLLPTQPNGFIFRKEDN